MLDVMVSAKIELHHIIQIMWCFLNRHNSNYVGLLLNYKAKPFDFSTVFCSGGHDIDPGGIDTAVTKNISQLCNVLFNTIKGSGEELSEIMRKNF